MYAFLRAVALIFDIVLVYYKNNKIILTDIIYGFII